MISLKINAQYDVLHYSFHIELNDSNNSIKCKASILLKALNNINHIVLDLTCLKNGKGMKVNAVSPSSQENKFLEFEHKLDKLNISLPENLLKDSNIEINIYYSGIPQDGLIISKNKYGKRTFFADNWPNRAHHWLVCNDMPNNKASVDFYVTAPLHYLIIANGVKIEETVLNQNKLTVYREESPLPTKIMVIGAADFAVQQTTDMGCIPISSWVFAENKNIGFKDYDIVKNILPQFIEYIGPYGYKKLANVQSKTIFGGMENAGAIFYFENSVNGNSDQETLFAHEIAHQWFGDMVTEKNFSHLWLSEGFATYLTHLYIEKNMEKIV